MRQTIRSYTRNRIELPRTSFMIGLKGVVLDGSQESWNVTERLVPLGQPPGSPLVYWKETPFLGSPCNGIIAGAEFGRELR